MTIDWSGATLADTKMIAKISKRAAKLTGRQVLQIHMDIIAAHTHGCPLDLTKFLKFNKSSFLHDIFGISEYLDKKTGKLLNRFVPRCAVEQG